MKRTVTKPGEKARQFNVWIPEHWYLAIREISRQRNISPSEFGRAALKARIHLQRPDAF